MVRRVGYQVVIPGLTSGMCTFKIGRSLRRTSGVRPSKPPCLVVEGRGCNYGAVE